MDYMTAPGDGSSYRSEAGIHSGTRGVGSRIMIGGVSSLLFLEVTFGDCKVGAVSIAGREVTPCGTGAELEGFGERFTTDLACVSPFTSLSLSTPLSMWCFLLGDVQYEANPFEVGVEIEICLLYLHAESFGQTCECSLRT
jgi:hypothetical protein